jgi:predicted RNase H-like nuclease (RuvC/YqgF family)
MKRHNDNSRLNNELENEVRILREKCNVPDNYGVNLQEIRESDSKHIENLEAKNTALEEYIKELEQERDKLRKKYIGLSETFGNDTWGKKGLRFKNLTANQMMLVDE